VLIDDSGLFAEMLREWEDDHKLDRPRGALSGQTPLQRLRQKTGATV